MTYESTGEVREPKFGEYYWSDLNNKTQQAHFHDGYLPKIIMRPVEEPREVVGYQVVLTIPPGVSLDVAHICAQSWVGLINRSNPIVKPKIKEIYAV